MLHRMISRVSSAHVIAAVALFFALGGGFALAVINGKGTVQKGAKRGGIASTNFETIRTIKGIGSLQAKCISDTSAVKVRVHNTSGETLRSYMDVIDSDGPLGTGHYPSEVVNNAYDTEDGHQMGSVDTFRYHIWPNDGSSRPQADMTVSSIVSGGGCEIPSSGVAVLLLTTE